MTSLFSAAWEAAEVPNLFFLLINQLYSSKGRHFQSALSNTAMKMEVILTVMTKQELICYLSCMHKSDIKT